MFCKHCGARMEGFACPQCGGMAELRKSSSDLERIMKPSQGKTYREGLAEGYQKGRQEGYAEGVKKGYGDGYSVGAENTETNMNEAVAKEQKTRKQRLIQLCSAAAMIGILLGGFVFSKMGYNKGLTAGKESAQKDAELLISTSLDEKYSQGYQDGLSSGRTEGEHTGYDRGAEEGYDRGYEQGVADTESRYQEDPLAAFWNIIQGGNNPDQEDQTKGKEPEEEPQDLQEDEMVLFSREINGGTKENPSEEVRKIQQRLIELNILDDKADGIFGRKTEQAVIKFQQENQLTPSGKIDPETYRALFPPEELQEETNETSLPDQELLAPEDSEKEELLLDHEELTDLSV